MDIVSHGLWGGITAGRDGKKRFWTAFGFGVMPDLLSFGILFATSILGLASGPDFSNGPPSMSSIPSYISYLYNITHSLIVFSAIFAIIWFIRKKPLIPMLAWPLHIVMDIFTHTARFFPTPFLWPISDFKISGISWGSPEIFFPNVILLAVLYTAYFISKRKKVAHNI